MTLRVEAIDPAFLHLADPQAELTCLYEGGLWLEGPLWLAGGQMLLFSDIPRDRVLRWTPDGAVREFSCGGYQNGRTCDAQGRLIACEHGGRRLVAIDAHGRVASVLAERHAGGRLNSPNDVVARPDGTLWFTDPDYGILSDYEGRMAPSEQAACHVFCLAPGASEPIAVVHDMVKPNGLAFSPDGAWLYVAESGGSHVPGTAPVIRRYALEASGTLRAAGLLATLDCGLPDGMAVDAQGNVWTSAGDGVHCFSPQGRLRGKLLLGCVTSNVCFGGDDQRVLFVTAAHQLFCVTLRVGGAALVR